MGQPDASWHEHPIVRAVLETASVLVVVLSPEGCVEYANGRLEALCGWASGEACGKDWFETFIPSRDRDLARSQFALTLREAAPIDDGRAIVTRHGDERRVDWQRRVVHDIEGVPVAVVCTGVDVTDKLADHDALHRANKLIEAAGDSIVVTDLAGIVTEWNSGAERLYGFTAAEMIGRPIRDLYAREDWETFASDVMAPLVALGRHRAEVRTIHKSGRTLMVALRLAMLRGIDGRPMGMVGYSTDITERTLAERRVAESEQRLRNVLDSMFAYVGLFSLDGRIIEINRAPLAAAGLRREDVIGTLFWENDWWAYSEDMRQQLRGVMRRAAHGETVRDDLVARVGGVFRTFDSTFGPLYDDEGRVAQVIGSGVDITDRKRAEGALRDSEALLRYAEEIAHVGTWEVDLATGTIAGSDEVFRIYEIDQSSFDGSRDVFLAKIHPDDREAVTRADEVAAQTGQGYELDYRLVMPDGSVKHIYEHGRTDVDATGTPVRAVGTVQDVTERILLAEARKVESLGNLARGIAHDFNNILLVIQGNAELALAQLGSDDVVSTLISETVLASRRGADLVRQILVYGREGSAPRRLMSPAAAVAEAVELALVGLPPSIELRAELGDVPDVVGNATQIHQVVMNLCSNANHAIGERPGRISITLQAAALGESDTPPGLAAGRYVHLAVSDTGAGMDAETRDRVFDSFFTTKTEGRGTGLGLAVVQGIVRAHEGVITVTSAPGEGTTFDVYLPAVEPEAESRNP